MITLQITQELLWSNKAHNHKVVYFDGHFVRKYGHDTDITGPSRRFQFGETKKNWEGVQKISTTAAGAKHSLSVMLSIF